MNRRLGMLAVAALLISSMASVAHADGSASILGLYPGATVNVGTNVSFTVGTSGFTNPTFTIVDSIGGSVNSSYINSSGNFSWTPNNSEIGSHTLTIMVSDSLGDSATASQTITVISRPTLTISSVTPTGPVSAGNQITFTATPAGLQSPSYSVADSLYSSSVRYWMINSSGSFAWTPIGQDVGTHVITVTARDYLGYTASSSQTFIVLGPPLLTLVSLPPSQIAIGQKISFSATTTGFISPSFVISDSFVGISSSTLAIDSLGTVTYMPGANDVGGHSISIIARDNYGHSGTTTASFAVSSQRYATDSSTAPTPYVAPTTPTTTSAPTTHASHQFKTSLSLGSRGSEVMALQTVLLQLNFYSGDATGYFGNVTKAAVMAFQKAHGIDQLGNVGPATRAALNAAQ